jgi:hypothetical protein
VYLGQGEAVGARKKSVQYKNRLRKTEYVLYLSHSRSLTSAVLQKGEVRGKGQGNRL